MADQRPFRFRLPWLSAPVAPAPRPTAEPQPPRPTVQIQAPAWPTTTIPIQRPPFRPAGIAPAPTPTTQITAQVRTEPQPPPRAAAESQATSQLSSPSRATIPTRAGSEPAPPSRETRAASVPPSPFRATPQSRAASVPPSPSRATTQTQAASQTQSPSRATPQSRAASVPPSPSRTTSQPRTAALAVQQPESPTRLASRVPGKTSSQPSSSSKIATQVQPTVSRSPSKKLQLATQETSQPPPTSTQSATQQEETNPAISFPLSQVPQEKKEIRAENVSLRQQQEEPVQASGAVRAAATPTPTSVAALEIPAASQKSDSNTIGPDHPMTLSEQLKNIKEDIFETKKTTVSSNGETAKSARARHAMGESHQKPSMSNGEKVPLHKEIREDISKFVHKLGMEHIKHPIGEKPVSIVTLAGENIGASMYEGFEPTRRDGSVHNHHGYKINPDESSENPTDGEGSSKGGKSKDLLTKEDPAMKAYINSNTQSVNNSILFESSLNERSPGVQLYLSHNDEEPSEYSAKPGPLETHKAEFKVTPAEMPTYEPTVK
uniref:NADH/NADPH oxidoreductase n=1 Tax=Populus tomentosa TaxID=118781 RepID=A0A1I9W021_POPTO|nr:NADH/NADPH oxidoreductase [Populus tomentosa]